MCVCVRVCTQACLWRACTLQSGETAHKSTLIINFHNMVLNRRCSTANTTGADINLCYGVHFHQHKVSGKQTLQSRMPSLFYPAYVIVLTDSYAPQRATCVYSCTNCFLCGACVRQGIINFWCKCKSKKVLQNQLYLPWAHICHYYFMFIRMYRPFWVHRTGHLQAEVFFSFFLPSLRYLKNPVRNYLFRLQWSGSF